jgi:hypothetical protein
MERRESTNEKTNTHTYVIVADDDVAGYIEQQSIADTNAYMVQLLQAERQRQKGQNQNSGEVGAKK